MGKITATPSMASKYSNPIFFILLTSLPLLFFMLYYEKILEKTLLESIKILTPPHVEVDDNYMYIDYSRVQPNYAKSITPEFSRRLIFLCFLRLVPLHLLELLSAISTIYLASKMRKQDPFFAFREAMKTSWLHKGRLRGVFITSVYVLSLSTCGLLGFLWFCTQWYILDTRDLFNPVLIVVYPITILGLVVKFPEVSAIWNTSLVVTVMEEVDGMRAFSLAFYFNKGSERQGLVMMVVFFALGLGLRIPCLFEGEDQEIGLVARTGLLWVVHLVKWVACTWYYFDGKNRVLQKKADLEVGGNIEGERPKNVP